MAIIPRSEKKNSKHLSSIAFLFGATRVNWARLSDPAHQNLIFSLQKGLPWPFLVLRPVGVDFDGQVPVKAKNAF